MGIKPMIRAGAPALALVLALAACDNDPAAPPTPDDVAQAAGNLVKPLPGLYRSTAEVTRFEVPGMPAQQAARLKEMMGSAASQTSESCMTKAQADEGFKRMAKQLGEGQQGVQCEFARFDAKGSKLDANLTCTGPGGVNVNMEMDGDIQPTQSTMTMAMTQKNAAIPGGEVRMVMKVTSERVGDCP